MMGWLPENVSTFGGRIDFLFHLIYWITAVICLLVLAKMALFLVLYRKRPGRPAHYSHGHATLEVIWTVVPALILVALTVMSGRVWRDIKGEPPPADVRVRVTGKQFNWKILYPGPDREFGTPDDLEAENDLYVPVDRNVRVELRSEDVIHSFFLPHLRVKQDAVPGRVIETWFEATRPGEFEIACAELCGFGHYQMRGHLYVQTPEEYDAWVRENWPAATAALGPAPDPGGAAPGGRPAGEGVTR
ncbi:MAG: cytochrome c oxidase subunit II [Acidobacteria bacterium]|nr:cytochrome c oxidase subunit II [Acidobacteriota bacterium]